MSDDERITKWTQTREDVRVALAENRSRREAAQREVDAAREELAALLARGTTVAIDASKLAGLAGVSRDTVHRLLRESDVLTWRQWHRLAKAAGIPQGEPRRAWFAEQGMPDWTQAS